LAAFDDGDLGVFSSRLVTEDRSPILLVFHDEGGDWQFLSSYEENEEQIVLVHLSHVLVWDPTIRSLKDLPEGWKAWRDSPEDAWTCEPTPPDQPSIR
jgi:hypothetical protein